MVDCPQPPPPVPDDVIDWNDHKTIFGGPVLGRPRSIAHLEFTARRAAARGNTLKVIQSAWNRTVEESRGSHDFDAVYDLEVDGLSWAKAQSFLRRWGWAAWHRSPPSFAIHHVHAISLGCGTVPCEDIGGLIPDQLVDYHNEAFGLSGMHTEESDESWFPDPQFVFDYDAWLDGGDDVQFEDHIPGTHQKEVGEALATIFAIDRRTQKMAEGINRAVGRVGEMKADIAADQALDEETQRRLFAKIDRVRDHLLEAIADEDDAVAPA